MASRPQTVLLPLLNLSVAPDLLSLAATLLAGPERVLPRAARVLVLAVVVVPPGRPPAEGQGMARAYRALLGYLPSKAAAAGASGDVPPPEAAVHGIIKVAATVEQGIREAAAAEQADLLLLHWKGYAHNPERHVFGQTLDALLQQPPCNLLLARMGRWQDVERILLPLRGGPNAELALDAGVDLAARLDVRVTVLHGVPRAQPTAAGRRGRDAPYLALQQRLEQLATAGPVALEQVFTLDTDVPGKVSRALRPGNLVIVGTPDAGPDEPLVQTTMLTTVLRAPDRPVLIARAARRLDLTTYRAHVAGRGPEPAPEQWFVEKTYRQDEFADVGRWSEARATRQAHISIVLPTRNDETRIVSLLLGLRNALQIHPEAPLADEILVVDGASEDNTAALAAGQGVPVLRVAPGPARGHGTRGAVPGPALLLRQALNLALGDILVWLDPKVGKLHPSYIPALVGPLLHDPAVLLVKPFWAAPGNPDAEAEPTEHPEPRFAPVGLADLHDLSLQQLARVPIYSWMRVFRPGLGAVINPLGNVFAARVSLLREVLGTLEEAENVGLGENDHGVHPGQRVAFAGGLVLETAALHGTRAIAQVEMQLVDRGRSAHLIASPDMRQLRQIADLLALLAARHDLAVQREVIQGLRARIMRASA